MKPIFPISLGIAFLAATAFAAPVPWQLRSRNLIVNGSFEEGTKVELLKSLSPKSDEITGWTVTRGQIDWMGTFWNHQDGKRSLDLHGSPGIGGVSQTFKTVVGAKYEVIFYLSAVAGQTNSKRSVVCKVDSEKESFEFAAEGVAGTPLKWEKQTLVFTATSKETTLELYSEETEDAFNGPAIDNVSVFRIK